MPVKLIVLLLLLTSADLHADSLIKINSMHYPVWVVRGQQTIALSPGSQLVENDIVSTGRGARAMLRLSDGSAIKLGESARFKIISSSVSTKNEVQALTASFELLRGTFRYTASLFKPSTGQQNISLQIGALMVQTGDSDIFARSNLERDLLCLLTGEVSVSSAGESAITMHQPAGIYIKLKGEPALAGTRANADQVRNWVKETAFDSSLGIAVEGGEWQLVLLSLSSAAQLKKSLWKIQQKGFSAERVSVVRNGRTLHRLLLKGFISIEDAQNARTQVEKYLGITDAWVWRVAN